MVSKKPACKDCGSTTRPLPYPGPRCATCNRERKKEVSARNHAKHVEGTYGISGDDYWALLEFQGGKCAICQKATGAARRLAVDHDHALEGRESVRGILCSPCNKDVIGRLDQAGLQRAIKYLDDPPARRFFGAGEGV